MVIDKVIEESVGYFADSHVPTGEFYVYDVRFRFRFRDRGRDKYRDMLIKVGISMEIW
jgi:hypothetical protein